MTVQLTKMSFSTIMPKIDEFYNVLSENRARLEPWFWWASNKVTPNKSRFALFIFMYLMDTKRKEILHKLNNKKLYDEQFMIYQDGVLRGMIGLDNIDNVKNNAELWGFISNGNKSSLIVDESVKMLEDYCITDKHLTSLYAKTQLTNKPVAIAGVRNNYKKVKIEKGVRISARNSGIADMVTWEKQLVK